MDTVDEVVFALRPLALRPVDIVSTVFCANCLRFVLETRVETRRHQTLIGVTERHVNNNQLHMKATQGSVFSIKRLMRSCA